MSGTASVIFLIFGGTIFTHAEVKKKYLLIMYHTLFLHNMSSTFFFLDTIYDALFPLNTMYHPLPVLDTFCRLFLLDLHGLI